MAAKRKFRETSKDADEGGEGMDSLLSVPLSAKRIARVYEFKGMMLCDIRELWFDAAKNAKPGKKGISLTLEQLQKLFAAKDEILEAMEKAAAGSGKSHAKRRKTNASAGEDDGEDEGEGEAADAGAAGADSSSDNGRGATAGAGTA